MLTADTCVVQYNVISDGVLKLYKELLDRRSLSNRKLFSENYSPSMFNNEIFYPQEIFHNIKELSSKHFGYMSAVENNPSQTDLKEKHGISSRHKYIWDLLAYTNSIVVNAQFHDDTNQISLQCPGT